MHKFKSECEAKEHFAHSTMRLQDGDIGNSLARDEERDGPAAGSLATGNGRTNCDAGERDLDEVEKGVFRLLSGPADQRG